MCDAWCAERAVVVVCSDFSHLARGDYIFTEEFRVNRGVRGGVKREVSDRMNKPPSLKKRSAYFVYKIHDFSVFLNLLPKQINSTPMFWVVFGSLRWSNR